MPRKNAQSGFDETGKPEQSLNDDKEVMLAAQQLAEAEQDYTDEVREIVRTRKQANERLVELVKSRDLPNGLYRVGEYVLEIGDRNGGGFAVKAWTSKHVSLKDFVPPVMAD